MQVCRKTTKKVVNRNIKRPLVGSRSSPKEVKDMLIIANSGKTKAIKKSIQAQKAQKRLKSTRIAAKKQEMTKKPTERVSKAKIQKESKQTS